MITTLRSAQHGERCIRWDVESKFKKIQWRPGGHLAADIDKGSANPGLL